ncbi:solute:Na+ symporter, SSS family [Salegentibacter holothuriorum]|uniref:Solute:Na+ symporter, SSS family n=1 Tax=Salegentibacter holothuriorum TaxID=241145 RepID=A0A1T5AUK2_9FLAO|nr:sodium/sugar symporter [Salegentibacter holothuriorum]SKB38662.1 solute:Na+ symporter, SSS family [Salegentibacter holothuriorum]
MEFGLLDQIIFGAYALLIVGIGLYVSRGKGDSSEGYFLADKSLPWWAIGASLIAANISAEQFIGMSGSGFAIGLAIASYEWMAAITLLLVGKFFLPIFIDKGLYTIPEFIEVRYGSNLKTILAVFWICLFVFVNLTSVLYLGATALDTIMGTGDGSLFIYAILGLAFFAAAYSLYGGLSAVAWTDVVQVVLLIIGGLITTFIALSHVTEDGGVISGMVSVYEQVPEKFSMILEKGEIITPNGKDAWWDLPGLAVLIGGLWVANLYYWGFNQYIIQRTLAAKSLRESQKGIILAGFLKLIVPLIVVIPGIIAYVMNTSPEGVISLDFTDESFFSGTGNIINDNAAPWLIQEFVPAGLKGLVLAALAAAIVSSVASMLNSTATIFTMDIYKPYFGKNSTEKNLVKVGRLSATAALIVAVILAPQLKNLGQVFQYIQEYTGVVSPGILAVFMLGLFWKKTTNRAAIFGVLASIPIALFFKIGPNGWIDSPIFVTLPFMHQMMLTWILTMVLMIVISLVESKGKDHEKGIELSRSLFKTGPAFNIGSFAILLIVVMLYALFW